MYNNSLGFTSLGAKYDHDLTKNMRGVYTFRVQEEELSKRLDASPRLRENTLKLLMNIFELDQHVYNLPFASQVAFIWTKSDDQNLDRNAHIQWVISTETIVEELVDEQDEVLPVEFNYTEFNDLAQYADSATHSVGIALSTRNDSVILIDPPEKEARQLKNWATRNEKCFTNLIKKKEYTQKSPQMFYQEGQKITSVADITSSGAILLSTYISEVLVHGMQKMFSQQFSKLCRYNVDLKDAEGTITASVFAKLGEMLLGYNAVQAMEYFKQNKELPLEQLHEELKTKTFIAKVRPAKQRDTDTYQHYTLDYYFEEPEGESVVRKMTIGCSQQQKLDAVKNLSMTNQALEVFKIHGYKFRREKTPTIVLTSGRKTYSIGINKKSFTHNWNKFVLDLNLQHGELLFFIPQPLNSIAVLIFGTNGIEKMYPWQYKYSL
ncbi:hypothetical protein ACH5RR_008758 [Cinchona calisaya]|uniref:Uncharacterized protein n=1 Tax=Cinchona calisaya TaxID=153742 RepID=A0ABD3AER6_9GENT